MQGRDLPPFNPAEPPLGIVAHAPAPTVNVVAPPTGALN